VPITALVQSGRIKAGRLGNNLQQDLAAAVAVAAEAAEAAEAATAAADADAAGGEDEEAAGLRAAAAAASEAMGAAALRASRALTASAGNSLAEVCSAQIELLLDLGRDIAAPGEYGRLSGEGGLRWPADSVQVAGLLRYNAGRMRADLGDVADGYSELVPLMVAAAGQAAECAAAAAAAAGAGAGAGEEPLDPLAAAAAGDAAVGARGSKAELEEQAVSIAQDGQLAMARIQDSFRSLLYVVLMGSLLGMEPEGEAQA
jgi:SWI/SNF-related matrix-associated actin-dependent regulator 1 of chromatin subfamily A